MLMMLMLDNANDANVKTNLLKVNTVLPGAVSRWGEWANFGLVQGTPPLPQ